MTEFIKRVQICSHCSKIHGCSPPSTFIAACAQYVSTSTAIAQILNTALVQQRHEHLWLYLVVYPILDLSPFPCRVEDDMILAQKVRLLFPQPIVYVCPAIVSG